MLRRDVLIGGGLAALAACAPKLPVSGPTASGAVAGPTAPQPWPPYRDAMAIDGAGGVDLVYPDDMEPADVARLTAIELASAHASGLTAVIMTVAPAGRFWLNDAAFEKTKRDMATWRAKLAEHPETFLLVEKSADLETARRDKRLGVVFTFQGTEPLGEDVERIPLFRELGVRVIQLTHNRHNLVGDGSTELGNAGLSNYGHEVVERLNAAKIVVDLAHGSQRTMHEGIAASKAPMLISHTGCRALSDLPRCTGDVELRMLADRGGCAGMIFWPYLRTDTQPMAIDVVRHLEHAINVCGEDHVGIGTDAGVSPVDRSGSFEKDNREMIAALVSQTILTKGRPADLYTFIPDLNVANRFELLGGLLAARGHSTTRIHKLLGGNFARVLRDVWG